MVIIKNNIDMEFSEIGDKMGGLTAEQVLILARYGMDILSITGIGLLSDGLVRLASKVLMSEDIDNEEYGDVIADMLRIAQCTYELNEQCMNECKTPFGLTGVEFDNLRFGFGKVKNMSEIHTQRKAS